MNARVMSPTLPLLARPLLHKLSDDEGDAANATIVIAATTKPGVVKALAEESVEAEDVDGPPGNKVRYCECPQRARWGSLCNENARERVNQFPLRLRRIT